MQTKQLLKLIKGALAEHKGQDICVIDVSGKTSMTDFIVIAGCLSEQHAQALSNYVLAKTKENNVVPLGVEGKPGSDWILLDFNSVILHIFTAQAREFYQLEKLWSVAKTGKK